MVLRIVRGYLLTVGVVTGRRCNTHPTQCECHVCWLLAWLLVVAPCVDDTETRVPFESSIHPGIGHSSARKGAWTARNMNDAAGDGRNMWDRAALLCVFWKKRSP